MKFKTTSTPSRRAFIKSTTAGLAGTAIGAPAFAVAKNPSPPQTSETLVAQLYGSLNDEQQKAVCFGFDHKLRSHVDNNWHVTKPTVGGGLFDADQQELIKEIFLGIHSDEYKEKVYQQVVHDSGEKGFGASSIALFGKPGTGKFEFVVTGRHCTRRCDGDSVEGTAFGGPIFYGHAADSFYEKADHRGNAYWFQAKRANEVFQALDGKQRELALIDDVGPEERKTRTVQLSGENDGHPGIGTSGLSGDQKELVRKVLSDLLAPFRKTDADEAMKYIDAGGFDNLHMAFYKQQDIGEDGVWDVWQVEGPNMIWYFRGEPHVHVWAHIKDPEHVS